jgi:hypothetical protein
MACSPEPSLAGGIISKRVKSYLLIFHVHSLMCAHFTNLYQNDADLPTGANVNDRFLSFQILIG